MQSQEQGFRCVQRVGRMVVRPIQFLKQSLQLGGRNSWSIWSTVIFWDSCTLLAAPTNQAEVLSFHLQESVPRESVAQDNEPGSAVALPRL